MGALMSTDPTTTDHYAHLEHGSTVAVEQAAQLTAFVTT
jgi:hypothetical protein